MNKHSKNLIDILLERAKTQPDRKIYRFLTYRSGDCHMEEHTIREVYVKSLEMAHALQNKGLRKGDRAIIFPCRTLARSMPFTDA